MRKNLTIVAAALLFAACNPNNEVPPPTPTVLDFESVATQYLAGPTSYGENLYNGHDGQYTGYTDPVTGLRMEINEFEGARNFWSGGVAISRWNDTTTAGPDNQCSVYAAWGNGGSKTFAVVNYSSLSGGSEVFFAEGSTEAAFDHFWVANTTYAALSMKNGDGTWAKKFSYEDGDWFLLTVSAENKEGDPTGTPVEFYLADFTTASSHGIVDRWSRVDLTPLGDRVHKLRFMLSSSDNHPDFGMNTPGYFCFDDLTFFK